MQFYRLLCIIFGILLIDITIIIDSISNYFHLFFLILFPLKKQNFPIRYIIGKMWLVKNFNFFLVTQIEYGRIYSLENSSAYRHPHEG